SGRPVVVHDGAMCTDDTPAHHGHGYQVLHEVEPPAVFDLEPVDSVVVTTLMDNVTDVFMPDQGPAHRPPVLSAHRCAAGDPGGGEGPPAAARPPAPSA